MNDTMDGEHRIVVIGGGIIGCTVAYYLTRHPAFSSSRSSASVTIFESCSVAAGASGKAGGLVAKWAFPKPLALLSFAEHSRLAEEHGGREKWGWRLTKSAQWEGRALNTSRKISAGQSSNILPKDLDWIQSDLTNDYAPMCEEGETSQVHPRLFTLSMCELAQERGAKLITGKVTAINVSAGNPRQVEGVKYVDSSGEEKTYSATHVVLSAGPWSSKLIPSLPIHGSRAHSIVIRPERELSAYAVFTEIEMPSHGGVVQPEIYTRPGREVYVSASTDDEPLPDSVADVKVDERICDAAFEQVASISPELRAGEVVVKQACYLPTVSIRTTPILGEIRGVRGLIVASGHTCWGICNAPGTAKAVSELIMDGSITCAKLGNLAPTVTL